MQDIQMLQGRLLDVDGTPFGRYRLLDKLGEGGMGEVWRAYDSQMNRVVALKVLPEQFASDRTFQERFRREAQSAAGLDEPHVVPIYDFGEIDGRLYITMRLIKGDDLQTLLKRGPLQPRRAVGIVEQIAAALQAAHEIGLVHRDVKPSNILIAQEDFAYLIDFGIARAAGQTGLTNTGTAVGTWAYMAPERLNTGTAEASADIYALTCVLYEALTGHRPFPGDSLEQQIVGHLTTPPPRPSTLETAVSESMDKVVAKGMAKNPDERYATTRDLAKSARAALSKPAKKPDLEPTMAAPFVAAPAEHQASTMAAHYARPTIKNAPNPSAAASRIGRTVAITAIAGIIAVLVLVVIVGVVNLTEPTTTATTTFPSPPSTSTLTSTSTSTSTVTSSATTSATTGAQASYTIADYIRDANITEVPVHHGDPGSPIINLPVPTGWHVLAEGTDAPYGGIGYNSPSDPNDPPTIVAIVSKLDGNVDPAKILQYAPGELKNLPGYEGGNSDGSASTLSGFKAWQLGGSYIKNGGKRVVAQKTVVITNRNGLYVLQLDAEAPDAQSTPLIDATDIIDEQTTINP